MLEELLESLDKEVFTPDTIDAIKAQFNEAVETKAKEMTETQIAEAVEKAVTEAVEVAVNEALEAKTAEIEEKADGYIAEALETKTVEIEENSSSYIAEKLAEVNESLDLFLDKVVEEFVTESKAKLNESLKAEKADMIIEAFESMLTAGSIDVMKIAEAKDATYSDAKLTESIEKYDALMVENLSLKKENTELAKCGIISEMKEGLSLVESQKFEKLASVVPFSRDAKYAEDLEMIKEQVKGAVETPTVITESTKVDTTKKLYSHLV